MSLLSVLLVVALSMLCEGQTKRRVRPPWDDLASELLHQGFKTDTASLMQLAGSDRPEGIRWMAIEILGLRQEQQSRPVLRNLLVKDQSQLVRETAALALAQLKDDQGMESLREMVKTASTKERQTYLASQLAQLHDPSAYSYVAENVQSKDPHLRFVSASALTSFVQFELNGVGGIDAIERLVQLAKDTDSQVRNEIVTQFALAAYKGVPIAKFRPIVERMMQDDPNEQVRQNAGNVLTLWNEMCRQNPSVRGCQ